MFSFTSCGNDILNRNANRSVIAKDSSWYEMPDNVVGVIVNPIDGSLANKNSKKKKVLYFLKGTEPTK